MITRNVNILTADFVRLGKDVTCSGISKSIIEKTTGRMLTGQFARYTSAVVPVKWQIKFIKDLALTIN